MPETEPPVMVKLIHRHKANEQPVEVPNREADLILWMVKGYEQYRESGEITPPAPGEGE